MDPIKNVGANDYAMTIPQQQNDAQVPQEDYSSMPMVYDPEMEDKKKAASSGLGMKALGAIAIAGLALWGGHAWGAKTAEAAKKSESLAKEAMETALKAKDDALKAKGDALKAKDDALAQAKKLKEANDAAYEIAENKHKGFFDGKKALREDIKKALRPDEAETKKVEEKAAKTAEAGTGEAAKKAEGAEEAAKAE